MEKQIYIQILKQKGKRLENIAGCVPEKPFVKPFRETINLDEKLIVSYQFNNTEKSLSGLKIEIDIILKKLKKMIANIEEII